MLIGALSVETCFKDAVKGRLYILKSIDGGKTGLAWSWISSR